MNLSDKKEFDYEFEIRNIGGLYVYYRRKIGDKLWSFSNKEEFELNKGIMNNEYTQSDVERGTNIELEEHKKTLSKSTKDGLDLKDVARDIATDHLKENPKAYPNEDVISMNVPLFIRMLELAREDIKSDEELHKVVEKVIIASKKEGYLTMADYDGFLENTIKENSFARGGNVMLAPNGEPSNLTPKQWKLVRTPEFKAWFGDWENDPKNSSKVIDENGEPLVVYHATDNKFWEFKKEKQIVGYYGKGFYFSNNLEHAKQYGKRVIPAFLNIKSVFELSDETPQELLNQLAEANVDVVDMGEENDIEQRSKYTFGYASENSDIFMNNLIKNGYYGIRMIYNLESSNYFFIAFEPNQIKLADGTNTTFDGNNPDIRFAGGGLIAPNGEPSNLTPKQWKLVRTPEFKAWFGDWENDPANASKVVDENGEPLVVYHGSNNPNINIFDSEKAGSVQYSDWGQGIYFTPSKNTADYYSNEALKKIDSEYNRLYEVYEKTQDFVDLKAFQNRGRELFGNKNTIVYSVFLNIKKPRIEVVDSMNFTDPFLSKNAKMDNRDGIFIKNSSDILDEVIAFEPNQIKLADGTNTTFNGNNSDIRFDDGGKIQLNSNKGKVNLKLSSYEDVTELVPVSELLKFREFNRFERPKYSLEDSKDNISKLEKALVENGVEEPLIIEYSLEDNSVLLIEGNHRLNVAENLGFDYLPARVVLRRREFTPLQKTKSFKVKGFTPDRYGYVPSDLKPSQVGIAGTIKAFEEGGIIEGQLHSECNEETGCGEKFDVGGVGHIIEAERDEAVIVSKAFEDNKEYEIKGTPSEIASALNVLGDGKNFDSGAEIKSEDGKKVEVSQIKKEAKNTDVESIDPNSIIINRRSMYDKQEYVAKGTPKQIASQINNLNDNGVKIVDGGSIKEA